MLEVSCVPCFKLQSMGKNQRLLQKRNSLTLKLKTFCRGSEAFNLLRIKKMFPNYNLNVKFQKYSTQIVVVYSVGIRAIHRLLEWRMNVKNQRSARSPLCKLRSSVCCKFFFFQIFKSSNCKFEIWKPVHQLKRWNYIESFTVDKRLISLSHECDEWAKCAIWILA